MVSLVFTLLIFFLVLISFFGGILENKCGRSFNVFFTNILPETFYTQANKSNKLILSNVYLVATSNQIDFVLFFYWKIKYYMQQMYSLMY